MLNDAVIQQAKQLVVEQKKDEAVALAEKLLDDGVNGMDVLTRAFIPGISEVGDLFGRGTLFLPELIRAADAMKAVTDTVNDALAGEGVKKESGICVIATVQGDVHDIGKCIVVSLLQANGFTVHDLGRDVATDVIIEKAVETDADIIGTSALLTTTMTRQKEIEQALKSAGLKGKIKTVVGGAPVTGRWAAKIGADAYAEDAQDGVLKIQELL